MCKVEGAKLKKISSIGFYVGNQYFYNASKGDRFPQIAAYKLEGRLLRSLVSAGFEVNAFSTAAISTYPGNKLVFLKGAKANEQGISISASSIVNLPVMKKISRVVGLLNGLVSSSAGRRCDAFFVYSAHSPNLVAAFLVSVLFKKPYFVYVPDLPEFMGGGRSPIKRALKWIDMFVVDYFVAKSSGVLVITKYISSMKPRWKNLPSLVIEGVADASESIASFDQYLALQDGNKVIFYAGGLSASYGLLELLDGFLGANIDADLWICGRGELEDVVAQCAEKNPRVKYLGFLSPDVVDYIQKISSCLIVARDPDKEYTKYSFPSKLLEYMSSAVPVLVTRLPGIPSEYFQYLCVVEDFSDAGIAHALELFFENEALAVERARLGKAWIMENKTVYPTGQKIKRFLEEVQ